MSATTKHISVCVCSYRRPRLLARLLEALARQETGGLFAYAIVVVDNDHARSAEPVVAAFAAGSLLRVRYCVEPRQNIALARNKAVESADGDFVAFIDDDEVPIARWLLTLFEACHSYDVDGVLGPVKPRFDEAPPTWVVRGGFYDRPTYPTGSVIEGHEGRTGNVLLKRPVLATGGPPFNPEFLTGEDQDFFGRMIDRGHVFVWCNEAVAYEVVPPIRWRRAFMLKRALLSGAMSSLQPTYGALRIAKSVLALPAYTAALPLALLLGQHTFMLCLVKLFDHAGGLLALLGVRPIKASYVTE